MDPGATFWPALNLTITTHLWIRHLAFHRLLSASFSVDPLHDVPPSIVEAPALVNVTSV